MKNIVCPSWALSVSRLPSLDIYGVEAVNVKCVDVVLEVVHVVVRG